MDDATIIVYRLPSIVSCKIAHTLFSCAIKNRVE
jgi:hypothetical protein